MRNQLQQQGLLPAQVSMPVIAVQVWRPLACLMQRWVDFSFLQGTQVALTPEPAPAVRPLIEAGCSYSGGGSRAFRALHLFLCTREISVSGQTPLGVGLLLCVLRMASSLMSLACKNLQLSMELLVSNVEAHADALDAVSSGFFEWKQLGVHRCDLVFLIRCLSLCSSLRADSNLKKALVSSLHVLFQGGLGGEANYFASILEDKSFPMPSPTTLGRMRFVLDIACMLQKRQEHSVMFQRSHDASSALLSLLDSSSQGNVNWLMIEYFRVQASNLEVLCKSACVCGLLAV